MSEANAFPERLALRCGPITAVDLALFAAASGDHNPLHLDAATARAAGFDHPVVHGMFTMACAARLFSRRVGTRRVHTLQTRFTGVALLGDTLLFEATRTAMQDGTAHYALTARTEAGTEIVSGTARVGPA
jgi:acyl dehydratase